MKQPKVPPIVPQHAIDDVKTALQHIANALPVIPKLEACGVNCDQYKETLGHYSQHLNTILAQFGKPH